jgi:translation initiation factor IF-3
LWYSFHVIAYQAFQEEAARFSPWNVPGTVTRVRNSNISLRAGGFAPAFWFPEKQQGKKNRRWQIIKDLYINEQIKAREVRVISPAGEQLGIMSLSEALKTARTHNLDLVNVAPQASPPVCKIMDYGRFKYEQSKRDKEARKNQKIVTIKEVKLRPNIEDHDFQVKSKNARKFLQNGDKVKVTIMFRGREITHPELGRKLCDKIAADLADIANVENPARLEGRNMIMFLASKP